MGILDSKLHVGAVPGRKSIALYTYHGDELVVLSYFVNEPTAIEAKRLLDGMIEPPLGYYLVHHSDLEKSRDALAAAEKYLLALNQMNASLHLAEARMSPLTSAIVMEAERLNGLLGETDGDWETEDVEQLD